VPCPLNHIFGYATTLTVVRCLSSMVRASSSSCPAVVVVVVVVVVVAAAVVIVVAGSPPAHAAACTAPHLQILATRSGKILRALSTRLLILS